MVRACELIAKPGRAALYDAISAACGSYQAPAFGSVIYAVTHSGDENSLIQPETLEEDLVGAGIRLFSSLIEPSRETRRLTPEETEDSSRIRSVVEATGGNVFILPLGENFKPLAYPHINAKTRGEQVQFAVHRLYQQMGELYRLDLRLPVTVDKPTDWKLEVTDENGRQNRRVEVHYPHKLMPCTTAR